MISTDGKVFVRANSHRAYQRLYRICEDAKCFRYNPKFWHDRAKGYYLIPETMLEQALEINGISKPKDQNPVNYFQCW